MPRFADIICDWRRTSLRYIPFFALLGVAIMLAGLAVFSVAVQPLAQALQPLSALPAPHAASAGWGSCAGPPITVTATDYLQSGPDNSNGHPLVREDVVPGCRLTLPYP